MDLNTLIPTIITATSALVAIIGGFLVSRVITLAGEKNAIERRLSEVVKDLHIKSDLLQKAKQSLLEDEAPPLVKRLSRSLQAYMDHAIVQQLTI